MLRLCHITVEHEDAAGLDAARTRDDAEQGRFSDPIGSDQADHGAGRQIKGDVVKRCRSPVTLRDALQARDWPGGFIHCATGPWSAAGHFTAGSVKT